MLYSIISEGLGCQKYLEPKGLLFLHIKDLMSIALNKVGSNY